ncbi:hypothetical protein Tco_0420452 [Tanacetum coccineum]
MVAFLEKSTGSEEFHQVIDFLTRSHICYALTKKPDVCVSFIKQFWRSAEVTTDDNGEVKITATIDDVTPTEVIQDQESSEKGQSEVSTAGAKQGTANEVPIVSTAEVNLSTTGGTVTIQEGVKSKRIRKDKEKHNDRVDPRKSLRRKQKAQIARDEEIARQWDEEERQRAMSEAKASKKIELE